ncbi:MAG: long-chain fatty acid--CoA ligase, partial [Promethearchaeota archaeon]
GPFNLKPTMKPYPEINLYQFLEDSAAKYPDNIAISYAGDELNFTELKIKVDKLASALVDFGIKKGDMVASVLPSCPEFVLIHFAAFKIGAIHVPLSVLHAAQDLEYELKESGAEIVLCSYRRLERLNEVKPNTKIKKIIYAPTKLFPDYELPEMDKPQEDGYYLLNDLIEKHEPHAEKVDINPKEDLALLSFTGGTTGLPKATMLTHYNLSSNVIQLFHWMMDPLKSGIIGKAAITICVPLFHAYGQISMHVCISWGLKILLMDPRDMVKIAETIKKVRPFMVLGVPTHYMYLIKLDIPKAPIFYISGAAPLPPELSDDFSKKTGVPMSEGYGATEASANTHINLSAISKVTGFMASTKTGIGVPVADTESKIVNPDTGEEVPIGEPGEIWVRGPQIMKGYWPTPGKGLTEEGWLKMGDIGIMDEDGYFRVVDRIKEMINVSGNKVYSRVYEDMLYEHEAVSEAAIIGIPDPERPGSERVKAFIQLKPDYEGKVTEEDIIAFCKEKFKPYAVPKAVEFRKNLPLTLAMKIFKRKLKDEELAKMKEEGLIK